MTRQTTGPIKHLSLNPSNRLAEDIYHQVKRGAILLDPPYQRGSVWTGSQRLDLMYSFLSGYPIGAVILNDRMRGAWERAGNFKVCYATVDGRQRLETVVAWFDGTLGIPASWLEPDWYGYTLEFEGEVGPWVTVEQLTEAGRRRVANRMAVPVVTAQVDSVEAEAEIFILVNASGTAQSDADMANAARIAGSEI